jgi:integrase
MQTLKDLANLAADTLWTTPPLSELSRHHMLSRASKILQDLGPNLLLGKLTPQRAQAMRAKWADEGLARATVATYWRTFSAMIRLAWEHDLCRSFTERTLNFREAAMPIGRVLTREESRRLLEAVYQPWPGRRQRQSRVFALWVEFALETGLRACEMLNIPESQGRPIRHGDIITLRGRNGVEVPAVRVHGKGAKVRDVPLSPRCMEIVAACRPYLSPAKSASMAIFRELRYSYAAAMLRRAQERAGITGRRITPHTLRRTMATAWLEDGATPAAVQQVLGHSSVATTYRYIGATPWLLPETASYIQERRERNAQALRVGADEAGVPT